MKKTTTEEKRITEVVFILDRSGSMYGLESDTIGGFNSMLSKQKKEEGVTLVSTILFNVQSMVLHDRVPLEKVPKMTTREYEVGGGTALLDAIGSAIHHIKNVHKYAREEDRPQKTLFVITTDGMENSSRIYSYAQVRKMIQQQQKLADWEFLFLGANIDAGEVAEQVGIDAEHAVDYCCDAKGTALNFQAISDVVQNVRCRAAFDPTWKKDIEKHYKKRNRS